MPTPSKREPAPESRVVLRSFDGGVALEQQITRPENYRDIEALDPERIRIPRGGGYSYAAASFGRSALVQDMRAFNRITRFDASSGILECEAGTTLSRVFEVVTAAGWCLAVQPGYPLITIGGCIAADVHGKNHFLEGTFSGTVLSVRVFHPSRGTIECTREVNRDLFELTCGGLGLTGQIVSARIQLQRLPARRVQLTKLPITSMRDVPSVLQGYASSTPLLYSWHNFTRRGARFGSGFLYSAEFIPSTESSKTEAHGKLRRVTSQDRGRLRVSLLNGWTVPIFNWIYETSERNGRSRTTDLFHFLFPVTTKVIFFELFGNRGFHEYQMLLPIGGFLDAVEDVRRYIEKNRVPVCLASCKLFRGEQSLLRFDGTGICIALDFPRDPDSGRFAEFLDEIVVRYRGFPNITKDSRLPRQVVEACYSECDNFRTRLRNLDPKRLYRSEVSERLDL